MSGWPHAVESIGAAGLHVHDLRHTGNQFAANSGTALKDLMTRMGHDSERAALIYQHEARSADQRITDAIDSHVRAESAQGENDDDGQAGRSAPLANCTLIARKAATTVNQQGPGSGTVVLTWAFTVERVTGIEPALSAWEADVLPLNYTRVHVQWLVGPAEEPGCAVFAQTSYRNR
jgi:hypothetical protein